MQTLREIRSASAYWPEQSDEQRDGTTVRAYRREVQARARTVVTDLHESGRGFVAYDTLRSPIDGRFAFSDVREVVDAIARRSGRELAWYGCDDIGMAVDVVAD